MSDVENVIIVGSGPAGYTAALYTARANLHPLVIEGFAWGGLLQQTTDVENYPGFPEGIMGPEMMQKFRDQAERFGARLITDQADRVELAIEPGGVHSVWVGDGRVPRAHGGAGDGRRAQEAGSGRRGASSPAVVSATARRATRLSSATRRRSSSAAATRRWRRRSSCRSSRRR